MLERRTTDGPRARIHGRAAPRADGILLHESPDLVQTWVVGKVLIISLGPIFTPSSRDLILRSLGFRKGQAPAAGVFKL